jgi:hypothetical protein
MSTGSHWRSYFECDTRGLKTPLRAQVRRTRIGPRLLVKGAVRNVALKANTNVRALARIIEAVLGGSMFAWAFSREGSAVGWLTRDLDHEEPHGTRITGARASFTSLGAGNKTSTDDGG